MSGSDTVDDDVDEEALARRAEEDERRSAAKDAAEGVKEQAMWVKRMLGMPIPLADLGPWVVGPPSSAIDRPGAKAAPGNAKPREKGKARVPRAYTFDGGKQIKNVQGIIEYTAPPPPIRELNFAGGGGKGTALFGAVQALQDGTLDDVKQINGSSVGAITSALLASGVTLEELKPIVDSKETVEKITDGTMGSTLGLLKNAILNRGEPLTGEGVREVVATNMDATVKKRIEEYQATQPVPNKALAAILKRMSGSKLGPTFQDMRDLAAIIPAIKEISVTGTYREELELSEVDFDAARKKGKPRPTGQIDKEDKNKQGQLFIFSADTTPKMPVALAVQASAAFPIAFKPVDIDLTQYMKDDDKTGTVKKDAWKVRFVDGGATNNTPTASSIGNERPLDPMPQQRELNFVFQGSGSAKMLEGGELPEPGGMSAWLKDKMISTKNWAAEYALSVDAQEHAEDFVVVPLKFKWVKEDGKEVEVDMSGMANGTLNFNPKPEVVEEIRKRTKEETEKRLAESKKPVTTKFASPMQMMMAIGMTDLAKLRQTKPPYPGSDAAYEMRERVASNIQLAQRADYWPKNPKERPKAIKEFLDDLDALTMGQADCSAYIAREICKAKLDIVIDNLGSEERDSNSVGGAIAMVSEAQKVFNVTNRVLKTLLYPRMRDEKPGGANIGVLETAAAELRQAVTWGEAWQSLEAVRQHYWGEDKVDPESIADLGGHEAINEFYEDVLAEMKNIEQIRDRK